MQLVLNRSQSKGITGQAKYKLHARADLTDEEKELVKANALGQTEIAYHDKTGVATGFMSALFKMMRDTSLTVDSFIKGKTFNCKDVTEMMEIQSDIYESSLTLRTILEMAKTFGGDEVINVDDELRERAEKERKKNRQ